MKCCGVLAAGLAAWVVACPAFSETPEADAVIVTATRTAQTADETLAAVTVIDRTAIERSQAKSLAELITGFTGLDSAVSGGYGKDTSFFLRGTNSDHVLVLIDGVKIGSATLGSTAWQFLPPAQIDRIEIVRGPRSSLYGSEAIGGLVQIFTRKGRAQTQTRAAAGGGNYGTYEAAASVSGAAGNSHFSLSAGHFLTEGFDARQPVPGPFGLDEPDRDGYRNESLSTRAGHRFGNGTEISAQYFRAWGKTEFDGNFQNQADFVQEALGVNLDASPANNWAVKLSVGRSRDDSENFKDGAFASNFDTKRDTATWQNDVTLSPHQLLSLGVDYQNDRISSNENFAQTERDNVGLFTQYQAELGQSRLLLGLRQDDNQQFNEHATGNVAWGYALSNQLRVIVSYGTAFKAPTFNELFFPGFGDPNLVPEESESAEIGLQAKQRWGSWDVRAFRTNIDKLIATLRDPVTPLSAPANIDAAEIEGIETRVTTTVAGWQTAVNLTWIDPRDKSTDKVLARRARQTLRIDADRRFTNWQIGASLVAQSHRFDDANNDIRVAGYGLLNLRAQYELAKHWLLRATVDNALDKTYQTAHTFNSAGRALFLSLEYQIY